MMPIYFTSITVEAMVAAFFVSLVALFLLTIPHRSKASLHIGLSLLVFSSIPICYVLAGSIYHPAAGYNRWLSAYTSIPAALHVIIVFFSIPNIIYPKIRSVILWGGWLLLVIGWLAFIYITKDAPIIFDFTEHSYTLSADRAQGFVAIAIILMVLAFTIIGIWRGVITKDKNRWVVIGILVSYLIVTMVPSVFNLRSRQGYMDRGTFMIVFNLLTVLGLFTLTIIYINNTKERTSFMAKIIGVSLVTFLLLFEFISNIVLSNQELAYNRQHIRDAKLAISKIEKPEDLKYIHTYKISNESKAMRDSSLDNNAKNAKKKEKILSKEENVLSTEKKEKNKIPFAAFVGEYGNKMFMEHILRFLDKKPSSAQFQTEVSRLLEKSHPYLAGYVSLLTEYAKSSRVSKLKPEELKSDFLDYVGSIEKILRPYRIKINKIPAAQFSGQIAKTLAKTDERFIPFKKVILEKAASSLPEIKEESLKFIALMPLPESRFYREDAKGEHYISFLIADPSKNEVYEAGFSYLHYRKMSHEIAKKFIIILLITLLFVLLGYRVFFYGALIRPLNSLLSGLKDVQRGKTDVSLEIFVEDEIGFITRSFNSMVRAIRAAEIKLQRYANSLENKVKARTAELSHTLEAVQLLKNQQDGDYFLTSLILRPLGANNARSENVKISFFVEQKKKFSFRKWESDIGGDICISDSIVLRGSNYVVFINGDAMGKSMQGAGGALVLGAAFQSVLERSRYAMEIQNQSPERWLKNAFSEMHAIFESFDGSMLMSAVFGLIEEKTGLMYFINAEHPWTVLYRDAKAKFIENDSIFRKLGSAIIAGKVFVQTFQLKHGDIIYAGSDGRDDIMLGLKQDGERIINEDENLFLQCIEKADADLSSLVQQLKAQGELTDDLSLLRIEYLNPEIVREPDIEIIHFLKEAKAARENKNINRALDILKHARERGKHPLLLKALFKNLLLQKDYKEAVRYGEEYCRIKPDDTTSLFALSYAYRKIGQYNMSLDLSERIRLREPENEINLIHLAECYVLTKKWERGQKLAEEVLAMNKNNKRAQVLLNKIKNMSS